MKNFKSQDPLIVSRFRLDNYSEVVFEDELYQFRCTNHSGKIQQVYVLSKQDLPLQKSRVTLVRRVIFRHR